MSIRQRLHARAHYRGLHGHQHVAHQRRAALIMIGTGLVRVCVWAAMLLLYVAGVAGVRHLYAQVAFVTILSVLALLLTDWGQVAASLAQLSAADAHHDSEATRSALAVDVVQLDSDIAQLAALQPGPDAQRLAAEIRARLAT